MATTSSLVITQGQDKLRLYQFGTNTARHYFCPICGVYTHSQRRFDPSQFAINVACLEGVSPFDFEEVPVFDGAHHPNDTPGASGFQKAGLLKFVKT